MIIIDTYNLDFKQYTNDKYINKELSKYRLKLNVTNLENKEMYVTTDDIQIYYNNKEIKNNSLFNDKFIILKLYQRLYKIYNTKKVTIRKGSNIDIEFYLNYNKGEHNISYSPVSTVFIKDYNVNKNEFILNIESIGNIEPKVILNRSLDIFNNLFLKLIDDIQHRKDIDLIINNNVYIFHFYNQNSSLIYFVKNLIFNNCKHIYNYIGIKKIHPLKKDLVLKIEFKNAIDEKDFINILTKLFNET